jgi:MFS superfamily sulfate permease-like transporter
MTSAIGKDIFIIFLITTPFAFIDERTALLIGATGTSILLIRRTMLFLSPGHFKDNRIPFEAQEWSVPKGVEILVLSNSATLGIIFKYMELLKSMGINTRILIISFRDIPEMNPFDICLLDEVINQLSARGTTIYLAEVDVKDRTLFKKYNLMQKVGRNEIFYKIEDAVQCAKNTLDTCQYKLKFEEDPRYKEGMN